VSSPEGFGYHPNCISVSQSEPPPRPDFLRDTFTLTAGDYLVLATDAFAKFLVTAARDHPRVLAEFDRVRDRAEMETFIAHYRSDPVLRIEEDDLTVVRLQARDSIEDWSFPTGSKPPEQAPSAPRAEPEPAEPVTTPTPSGPPEAAKPFDPGVSEGSAGRQDLEPQWPKYFFGVLLILILAGLVFIAIDSRQRVALLAAELRATAAVGTNLLAGTTWNLASNAALSAQISGLRQDSYGGDDREQLSSLSAMLQDIADANDELRAEITNGSLTNKAFSEQLFRLERAVSDLKNHLSRPAAEANNPTNALGGSGTSPAPNVSPPSTEPK